MQDEFEQMVHREVDEGETLHWWDRPDPKRVARRDM